MIYFKKLGYAAAFAGATTATILLGQATIPHAAFADEADTVTQGTPDYSSCKGLVKEARGLCQRRIRAAYVAAHPRDPYSRAKVLSISAVLQLADGRTVTVRDDDHKYVVGHYYKIDPNDAGTR